jgi:hypothetical protein
MKSLLILLSLPLLMITSLTAAPFTKAGIQFQVPATWTSSPPSSSMRAGEWKIPRLKKDSDDGEFVVFYFGIDQGGDTQSNLNRWKNQVTNAQGAPAPSEISVKEVQGLHVNLIQSFGTYAGMSSLPGVPPSPKPNYGFIGAVIEGAKEGNLFWRIAGPEALIKSQLPQIQKMIESLKRIDLLEKKK